LWFAKTIADGMNAAAGDQTEQVSHVAAWRLGCLSSE
jgi:hypothetical protein